MTTEKGMCGGRSARPCRHTAGRAGSKGRRKSRAALMRGLLKKLDRSGFRVSRKPVKYHFESPRVWLIEPKCERSEPNIEGSGAFVLRFGYPLAFA